MPAVQERDDQTCGSLNRRPCPIIHRPPWSPVLVSLLQPPTQPTAPDRERGVGRRGAVLPSMERETGL